MDYLLFELQQYAGVMSRFTNVIPKVITISFQPKGHKKGQIGFFSKALILFSNYLADGEIRTPDLLITNENYINCVELSLKDLSREIPLKSVCSVADFIFDVVLGCVKLRINVQQTVAKTVAIN